MRDDEDIVRSGEGHDAPGLCDAAKPRNVRLQDVRRLLVDERLEAEAGVFMLARRQHEAQIANHLLHFGVTIVLVRREELFHPREVEVWLREPPGQRDGVWDSERHVTVEHQREAISDEFTRLLTKRDVFLHALSTIGGPEGARNLAANEAEALPRVRPRGRRVHREDRLRGPAEKHVDRLLPKLPQEVPQGQVHGREGLYRQALASVVQRRAEHLVPHKLYVSRILALDEAAKVVLDNVARRGAADGDARPASAIFRFDLDNHAPERVYAP
mmetsp:Transcript_34440/g.94786  ORF Transcript_34440/g.94786 Transcript_34440/m.94786 type:complete len:272 (-) Transcript_34440:314-1129(-)